MTEEFLENALGEVRDAFVAEAAEERKTLSVRRRKRRQRWIGFAAVLCVAVLCARPYFLGGGASESCDSAAEETEYTEAPAGYTLHSAAAQEEQVTTADGNEEAAADAETHATTSGDGFLYYVSCPELKQEGQAAPVRVYTCEGEPAAENGYLYLQLGEADTLTALAGEDGTVLGAEIAENFQSLASLTSKLRPLYLAEYRGHYYACIGQEAYPLEQTETDFSVLPALVMDGEAPVSSFYAADSCP